MLLKNCFSIHIIDINFSYLFMIFVSVQSNILTRHRSSFRDIRKRTIIRKQNDLKERWRRKSPDAHFVISCSKPVNWAPLPASSGTNCKANFPFRQHGVACLLLCPSCVVLADESIMTTGYLKRSAFFAPSHPPACHDHSRYSSSSTCSPSPFLNIYRLSSGRKKKTAKQRFHARDRCLRRY